MGNVQDGVVRLQCFCGYPIGDYLLVALIGGLLGGCELLSRYRDEPGKAVLNWAAFLYIGVNIAAAVVALLLIRLFHVDFGITNDPQKLAAVRVLAAGLGAMAFFRTSLFTARVGDQDVPLGPGVILQILLNVTDRAVDRGRAKPRAEEIAEIMRDVDFFKAKGALPPLCFGLMQNVTPEEQNSIADQVNLIRLPAEGESSRLQSLQLGLLLLGLVGPDVLKAAIAALKGDLGGGKSIPDSETKPEGATKPDPGPKSGGETKPDPDPKPGGTTKPDPDPKPGGVTKPDLDPKPGAATKPEIEAKPDEEAKPERETKPEGEARPDGLTKPEVAPSPGPESGVESKRDS